MLTKRGHFALGFIIGAAFIGSLWSGQAFINYCNEHPAAIRCIFIER